MDESRKQFEEWIKAERPKLFLDLLETDPTRYSDPATERLWQSWQASRQDIEISPPDTITTRESLDAGYMGDYASGRDDGIEDTMKVIREAGIKIKGE